jgi:hypothetical protein
MSSHHVGTTSAGRSTTAVARTRRLRAVSLLDQDELDTLSAERNRLVA